MYKVLNVLITWIGTSFFMKKCIIYEYDNILSCFNTLVNNVEKIYKMMNLKVFENVHIIYDCLTIR